jgi:hypothetical protein
LSIIARPTPCIELSGYTSQRVDRLSVKYIYGTEPSVMIAIEMKRG